MEINSELIIEKKTLQLKSRKLDYPLEAVKIHDLPNLGEVKFDATLKEYEPQWIEEASPKVTLFKTTVSRLLSVQIIYVILNDIYEKKENLSHYKDEQKLKNLIENIIYVNECEWNYFQNSKIKYNFIIKLVKSFIDNYTQIIEVFEKYRHQDWKLSSTDLLNLAIPYSASAEFIIIKSKAEEENINLSDRKKILIHEYLLISEFFVQDEETKFINAIIHKILNDI